MSMESDLNIELNPVNIKLLTLQDDVRNFFDWELSDDIDSANNLLKYVENSNKKSWIRTERNKTLLRVITKLKGSNGNIVIIGAAISTSEIKEMINPNNLFVAADGAVGIFSTLPDTLSKLAWSKLVCVVSDADGGKGTEQAFIRGVPIILHAHGDNQNSWKKLLILDKSYDKTKIVLTHQIPNKIDGMYNIGGFTDGDRAACFVRSAGVPNDNIIMAGTRTDIVGKWSGITNKNLKLLKLEWMAKVLSLLKIKY